MKCLALLALTSTALFAQSPAPTLPNGALPPPEKTPTPAAATPSPSATPKPSPKPTATATPTATPSAHAASNPIDLLSPDDVKQAVTLLKEHYVQSDRLTDTGLGRATLQGLLERLGSGVALVDAPDPNEAASPFRSEILGDSVGYVRLGDLTKSNLEELSAALKKIAEKPVKSVILDLRATALSSDYDLAAEVAKSFGAKGRLLFTQKKSSSGPEQIFTANVDPAFQGLLIVLVDDATAGAGEVLAAALRSQAQALVVGEKTAGRAVAFSDLRLSGGKILRVATAEISVPDVTIYPGGVQPDIVIAQPEVREILQAELSAGVLPLLHETPRIRMNEAALVAGTNPELDALEAAQQQKTPPKTPPHDAQLERAMDLITTISLYEKKASVGK